MSLTALPLLGQLARKRLLANLGLYTLGIGRAKTCAKLCREELRGKFGLEIGGPSRTFSHRHIVPVYPYAEQLDNCNYAAATVWEGAIRDGYSYRFHRRRPAGYQYIREAVDLRGVPTEHYDFLISSHVIEHVANPLRALGEWMRVVKGGGLVVLVVPHKEGTFDHRRPVTTLAHLIEDWEQDTGDEDLTHLPEILALHDSSRDPLMGSRREWEQRCRRNFEYRCLHHHVFDPPLVVDMMQQAGLHVLTAETAPPFHIVAVGRKPVQGPTPAGREPRTCSSDHPRRAGRQPLEQGAAGLLEERAASR